MSAPRPGFGGDQPWAHLLDQDRELFLSRPGDSHGVLAVTHQQLQSFAVPVGAYLRGSGPGLDDLTQGFNSV